MDSLYYLLYKSRRNGLNYQYAVFGPICSNFGLGLSGMDNNRLTKCVFDSDYCAPSCRRGRNPASILYGSGIDGTI